MSNKWLYVFMLLGVVLAFSRGFFNVKYHQWLLVLAMALLVFGIYNLSKRLSSKRKEDLEEPYVREEKE